MSDADDADLEAQLARLEARRERWRKEEDERKARLAQEKIRLEEWRKERKELDRRWEDAFQAAGQEIDRIKAESTVLRGMLKRRTKVLTIAGAAIGVALIWGASQTTGFWSLLMNALGTGLLFVATVAVAAYFVSRYWKAATETPNEEILSELQEVHSLLSHVSVATDSRSELLERLDYFLMEWEAERQVEQEDREERARELLAKLRERGHLPPETEQENQGEDS
jgi:hypothetical protein